MWKNWLVFCEPHKAFLNPCTQVTRDRSLSNMKVNSSKLDNATINFLQNSGAAISISILYIFITGINLVGNGLSMWLLLFRTSPKSPSIIFMINLTLTDMALGAALPFQISYQLQGYQWNLGPNMCRYFLLNSDINGTGGLLINLQKKLALKTKLYRYIKVYIYMCHSFSSITLILYRYFKGDRAWQSWCYDSESSHIFK